MAKSRWSEVDVYLDANAQWGAGKRDVEGAAKRDGRFETGVREDVPNSTSFQSTFSVERKALPNFNIESGW